MRKLVTSTALVGTSSVFVALATVVRTKILAVTVGVEGVGLLAQLGNFLNVMSSVASLGVGVGMAKLVAEFASVSDYSALERLKRTGTFITWSASIVAVAIACVLSRKAAGAILVRPELWWAIVVSVIAVPTLVQTGFHVSVMQGLKQMRHYATANALVAVVGLVALVPLVYVWGWNGAVVHLAVAGLLGYLAAYTVSVRAWRLVSGKAAPAFDKTLLRELLAYGLSGLVATAFYWANLLAIRSMIIRTLGPAANGLYQVSIGISIQYLALILGSVWAYAFPRLSELKENNSLINELRNSMRLATLLVTGSAAMFLLLRRWVIPLLFQREFLDAEGLIPAQVVADFLKATAAMMGVWLLPRGKIRVWIGFEILLNAVLLGGFLILFRNAGYVGSLGLLAAPLAHAGAYLIHCCVNYVYARRSVGFSFGGPLRSLLFRSLGLLVVCGFVPAGNVPLVAAGFLLVAVWARFSVTAEEARSAWDILKSRLPRLTGRRRP